MQLIVQGDEVVALAHEHVRAKATGQVLEQNLAQVFTVREGKIKRFRYYFDTAAVVAVFGRT
jgi:ketosteroid isomerase-like protein